MATIVSGTTIIPEEQEVTASLDHDNNADTGGAERSPFLDGHGLNVYTERLHMSSAVGGEKRAKRAASFWWRDEATAA